MVLQIKNTKELTQTKTDFSERGLALKVLNRKHFMSHSFVLAFFCTSIIMSRMSSSWTATGCIIKYLTRHPLKIKPCALSNYLLIFEGVALLQEKNKFENKKHKNSLNYIILSSTVRYSFRCSIISLVYFSLWYIRYIAKNS